jgi:mannose-6-phosphate isomerase-like protein (cupin superfamily)
MLEHVARTNLPLILSTGGATISEIDNVVQFLQHREKDFALMHCVAEYPTRAEHMELNQIDLLKARYPGLRLGYSTHENPNETMAVGMVIAKGCTILEKHVGVASEKYALNEYSASPDQVVEWLKVAERAFSMLGVEGRRLDTTKEEQATLLALRRGMFAKRDIPAGHVLQNDDVFMAIPTQDEHVVANEWSKYNRFVSTTEIKANAPILHACVNKDSVQEKILSIVLRVNDMLRQGNIVIPNETQLEISHHYGVHRFYEVGAALITIINRDYCKKVIVMLPGQKHPTHHHKKKDETLHVLHGNLTVTLDGETRSYGKGEMIVVEPEMKHSFETDIGAVFEEISSTHYKNDSHYSDEAIGGYSERKTLITYWSGLFTPPEKADRKSKEPLLSPAK